MNTELHEKIKQKIREVLSELKPGESLKRKTVWCIVHSRLLEESPGLFEDIHEIFYSVEDRPLRKIVEGLKTEGLLSVGSSPGRGYFRIYSQEDLNESTVSKQKKIYGLFRAIRREKENAERQLGVQLYIDSIEDMETKSVVSEKIPEIPGKQETLFNIDHV